MHKRGLLYLVALLVLVLEANALSIADGFFDATDAIFDADGDNDIALIKFGLWLILFFIVFRGAEKISQERPGVAALISFIISLLAVRYLPSDTVGSFKEGFGLIGIVGGFVLFFFLPYFLTKLIFKETKWSVLIVFYLALLAVLLYTSSYWGYEKYLPRGYMFYDVLYYLETTTWLIWITAGVVLLAGIFRRYSILIVGGVAIAAVYLIGYISRYGGPGYMYYDIRYMLETGPFFIFFGIALALLMVLLFARRWKAAIILGVLMVLALLGFYYFSSSFRIERLFFLYDIFDLLGVWWFWVILVGGASVLFYLFGLAGVALFIAVGLGAFYAYTRLVWALIGAILMFLLWLIGKVKPEEGAELKIKVRQDKESKLLKGFSKGAKLGGKLSRSLAKKYGSNLALKGKKIKEKIKGG